MAGVRFTRRSRSSSWLRLGSLGFLLLVAGAAAIVALAPARPRPLGIPGHWRLVFDSEFRGPRLPPGWQTGWFGSGVTGHVNGLEADCYSPRNVTLPGDGSLHLSVTTQPSYCRGQREPDTGALISTNPDDHRGPGFAYTYGVIQARVYIPATADGEIANWPAVWAVTSPSETYGEDDVIEGLNGDACFHVHTADSETGDCPRLGRPGWHTVASLWEPGSITYYYDGRKVGRITSGISSRPMYLVLDNTSVAAASVPDTLRVKYVRVWQRG